MSEHVLRWSMVPEANWKKSLTCRRHRDGSTHHGSREPNRTLRQWGQHAGIVYRVYHGNVGLDAK